jgi:hypothetical protein
VRRTEIAVGINPEQEAELEEDPENVALPIGCLSHPADDFKMSIAVNLNNLKLASCDASTEDSRMFRLGNRAECRIAARRDKYWRLRGLGFVETEL